MENPKRFGQTAIYFHSLNRNLKENTNNIQNCWKITAAIFEWHVFCKFSEFMNAMNYAHGQMTQTGLLICLQMTNNNFVEQSFSLFLSFYISSPNFHTHLILQSFFHSFLPCLFDLILLNNGI